MKTEDLLQKYVSIGLSKDERFELEKRALEDDFLAEAWEGLQLHQGSTLRQKWNAIQAEWRLKYKSVEKPSTKVLSMRPWMQYATAAAVLLLGAALFFMRSDDSFSEEGSIVALEPIEVSKDQEIVTASEAVASTGVIFESEEPTEVEKHIPAKTEKIMPLSNASKEIASAGPLSKKTQTPSSPQKSSDIAYVAKTQSEVVSTETKNSLIRTDPTPIPNSVPSAEGRAAIPIDKEVKGFENVEIKNANETPIIAKIENVDHDRQKSGRLFEQSKKARDNEGAKLSDLKEGLKLTTPENENYSKINSVEGLKKNILGNSKISNDTDPAQSSLLRARDLFLNNKDYEGARSEALLALELNSNLVAGHELIGDIYAAVSYTCGTDVWNQSLAVLAAYDQFAKALSVSTNAKALKQLQNKMDALQDRFPTKDEGFLRGVKAGSKAKVSCWIGETVTIRFK